MFTPLEIGFSLTGYNSTRSAPIYPPILKPYIDEHNE